MRDPRRRLGRSRAVSRTNSNPILLYDGVCGLCTRFVQFILRRDRSDVFRFASLQSVFAASMLARHGANPSDVGTVYIALNYQSPNESLLSRSDAVLFVLKQLRGQWRFAAFFMQLIPEFLRDAAYNVVARNRYRIFGRFEVCPLPRDQDRTRFLDR
jgi:predicted DCC family thiol-disulfide oxidoreductase YuxK